MKKNFGQLHFPGGRRVTASTQRISCYRCQLQCAAFPPLPEDQACGCQGLPVLSSSVVMPMMMMKKKDVGPCSPCTDRKVLKIKQPLNQRCQRSFHILYFIRCSTPSLLFRMSLPTPSQSPELIFQFRGGPKRGDAALYSSQPSLQCTCVHCSS